MTDLGQFGVQAIHADDLSTLHICTKVFKLKQALLSDITEGLL